MFLYRLPGCINSHKTITHTLKMYKALFEKLVEMQQKLDSQCDCTNAMLHLPIESIDKIPVEAFIKIYRNGIYLQVLSKLEYWDRYHTESYPMDLWESPMLKVEDESNLKNLFEYVVAKLRFNACKGVFETEDNYKDVFNMFQFLNSLPNVKTNFDECCVCHEMTQSKTVCGHRLCRPCMFSIEPKQDPEDPSDTDIYPCPICRNILA